MKFFNRQVEWDVVRGISGLNELELFFRVKEMNSIK